MLFAGQMNYKIMCFFLEERKGIRILYRQATVRLCGNWEAWMAFTVQGWVVDGVWSWMGSTVTLPSPSPAETTTLPSSVPSGSAGECISHSAPHSSALGPIGWLRFVGLENALHCQGYWVMFQLSQQGSRNKYRINHDLSSACWVSVLGALNILSHTTQGYSHALQTDDWE